MLNLLLSLMLLSVSSAHASPLDGAAEDAIHNGNLVAAGGQAWRSVAKLEFNGYMCTGVFINYDTLITAAHCNITNDSSLYITLYKENDPSKAQYLYLQKGDFRYTKHPRYVHTGQATDYDLSVVVLKNGKRLPEGFTPAEFVTSDYASATDPGQPAFLVGSGMTGTSTYASQLWFQRGTISQFTGAAQMMVESAYGKGVCGGDSGGPVFVQGPNGRLMLYGVINATSGEINAKCGTTVYTTVVGAAEYQWLQGVRAL